ncbi:MAG: hypothetical protein F4X45_01985 [Chloroflexi bacterium]|nr:hypothetical protein [Chloroflexota bacterium]
MNGALPIRATKNRFCQPFGTIRVFQRRLVASALSPAFAFVAFQQFPLPGYHKWYLGRSFFANSNSVRIAALPHY